MKRRAFLASAAASLASTGWAGAGAPVYLASANDAANRSWMVGLSDAGHELFRLPIPSRGHAAAAHPTRALAVAFARRPGRFAVVIDCRTGAEVARLTAPVGRHFYGHGAFDTHGALLLTTENAFDEHGEGRIGIWDVAAGFRRIGDLPSGGIGPHEILRLPSGGFAVANGGIQTHPDYGRTRLNLPTMHSNLAYLDSAGHLRDIVKAPAQMRQNSIRHMALGPDGALALALQWQGAPLQAVPLVALHRPGAKLQYLDHPRTARLKHYAGSIAWDAGAQDILVTGPKGGAILVFDATGRARDAYDLDTASGVAPAAGGAMITRQGGVTFYQVGGLRNVSVAPDLSWDNHLVRI